MHYEHLLFGPAQEILVLIPSVSIAVSDLIAHVHSLTRAFTTPMHNLEEGSDLKLHLCFQSQQKLSAFLIC